MAQRYYDPAILRMRVYRAAVTQVDAMKNTSINIPASINQFIQKSSILKLQYTVS
jgi:hypothetical protein